MRGPDSTDGESGAASPEVFATDGSCRTCQFPLTAATLDEVLDIYAAGGRVIESGDNMGDGTKNPHKSGFVNGFVLTDQQRIDVRAFLESLTDETFLTDPALSDPFVPADTN